MSTWKGGYVHECSAHIVQKKVLDPLVLKLQETVSCLMLVLGAKRALNH